MVTAGVDGYTRTTNQRKILWKRKTTTTYWNQL